MKFSLRLLYLYLFSFVGLLIIVIGMVNIVDLAIKVYVFDGADVYQYRHAEPKVLDESGEMVVQSEEEIQMQALEEAKRARQRDVSSSASMILVGLPLYLYHWKLISKERKG